MEIKWCCGGCGVPLNENGEDIIDIPKDYDPRKYLMSWCQSCAYEEQMKEDEENRRIAEEDRRWHEEND